jgi:two-component system, NtrC family, response regulator AtoC
MKKALIVDDIPEYLDTLEAYLEERFDILKAKDLSEAKDAAADSQIDLAVIDIRLKEDDQTNKDGLVLLDWLKKRQPSASVIVMSAYREFEYAVEALNAGADYFIRKPIDPQKLNAVIEDLLAKKGKPKETLNVSADCKND